ncbi:MAG: hypothetical protein ACU837_15435 [Gammaproteobacteria bacterium]
MNYRVISTYIAFLLICCSALLQGCSIPARLSAVPQNAVTEAEIPGMPGIRYMASGDMKQFVADARRSLASEISHRAKTGQAGMLPPANLLAISGGGVTARTVQDCCAVGPQPVAGPNSNW